ncbi:MAG: cytochrome b [Pseudomonadales bacterium]|nr:cytochrome b [Pseudomonadales bacterium]
MQISSEKRNLDVYDRYYASLHWVMAFLIILTLCLIETKGMVPNRIIRYYIGYLHIQIGLSIALFTIVRVVWRMFITPPVIKPALPLIQKKLSSFVHSGLYAMLIIVPWLGVFSLESKGKSIDFFGIPVPMLIDEDYALPYALSLKNYHELLGNIFMVLIGVHVFSALYHHVVRKDNVLKRMLP